MPLAGSHQNPVITHDIKACGALPTAGSVLCDDAQVTNWKVHTILPMDVRMKE